MFATQWSSGFLRNTQDKTASIININSPSEFKKEDLLTDGAAGFITNASKQQPVDEWIDKLHNFSDPRVLDAIPSNVYIVLWDFTLDPQPKYSVLSIHDKRTNVMSSSNYGDFSSIIIAEIQKCCTGVSGAGSKGMDKGLAIWGNIHDDGVANVSTPLIFSEGLSTTQSLVFPGPGPVKPPPSPAPITPPRESPDECKNARIHNFISGGMVIMLLALAFYVVLSLYMKSLYKQKYPKRYFTHVVAVPQKASPSLSTNNY